MRARRRALVRLSLAAVAAAWILLPVAAPAQGDPPPPVAPTVRAVLTAEAVPPALEVIRTTDRAQVPTDLQYLVGSSAEARRALVSGEADLVVSGPPLSAEDRQALEASGRGVVSAPVQAVGLQVFGWTPDLRLFEVRCDEVDPETGEEPPGCGQEAFRPYEGPLRFRPSVLASAMFNQGNIWASAEFREDVAPFVPEGFRLVPFAQGPRPVVRSDADAYNLYVERYLASLVGDQRTGWLQGVPGADPSAPPGETWPDSNTASRQGMDNVVSQLREGLDPGSSVKAFGGALGGASTFLIDESFDLNAAKPVGERVNLFRAEIRNAAGEWILATPDSITAAVAAGDEPNVAATRPVPGAYPITWVNRAYAPARGLTAEQANGVATYIRLQVTQGRTAAPSLSDGRITQAMVTEALRAADEIVESNCAAAKGTVVTSTTGAPWAPPGTLSFGSMKLCQGAPPPPTTTTAPPTDEVAADLGSFDTGSFDSGSFDTGTFDSATIDPGFAEVEGFSELAPATDAALGADVSAASAGAAGSAAARADAAATPATATVGRRMPLGIPGQTLAPLDRMVTLGLGALAFLVLRSLYLRGRSAW